MTLYNAKSTPQGLRITKFDASGNPESSYITSDDACDCPAGARFTCRHRSMLPMLRPIADSEWFYDYDRHDVVNFSGMTKATHDRLTMYEQEPQAQGTEPALAPHHQTQM
jgi:hypothetical protein